MRRTKYLSLIASGLALCLSSHAKGASADCNGNLVNDDTEFLDPSTLTIQETSNAANGTLGWSAATGEALWFQSAEAEPGANYIDQVSFWATGSWTRGERFVISIFDDPNNDGNPEDAVLLREADGYVNVVGQWQTITFSPPVYVGDSGEGFFYGFGQRIHRQTYPIGYDTTVSTDKLWATYVGVGGLLMADLVGDRMAPEIPYSGLIRARGRMAAMPDCNGSGVMDVCETNCDDPYIIGVNRLRFPVLTNNVASFEVVFSEFVENVDANDFTVNATGTIAGAVIEEVENLGNRYRVHVNTGTGVGTLGLSLVDNGTIIDGEGNPLMAGDSSLLYQVDNRKIAVSSVTQMDSPVVAAGPVTYRVQFDGPVTGANTTRFRATSFGTTGAVVSSVTPLGVNPFEDALDLAPASTQHGTVPAGTYFDGPFTIEAWIMPDAYSNWGRVIDFSNGPANNNVFLAYSYGTSGLLAGGIYQGATQNLVGSPAQIPLNRWSHVAFVYDGTYGILYLNGNEMAKQTMPAPTNVVRSTCYMGRSAWAADGYSDMKIDDLRIWDTARTRQQIVNNMTTQLTGGEVGLTAAWKFNEGIGTTVADITGLGHDMTLVNSPVWTASDAPGWSEYDVQVNGTGDGLLGLNMTSGGPFSKSGEAAADPIAPYYRIDSADPLVTAITRADDNPTSATEVTFAVEYSEPVQSSSSTDFQVFENGVSGSVVSTVDDAQHFVEGFDGVNDIVTLPGGAAAMPADEITIEFWQYVPFLQSNSTFSVVPDVYANRLNVHVPYGNGVVYWDCGDIYNGGRLFYTPPVSIVGSWQHFAFVSSASENAMRIYRNGVLEAEKAGVSPYTPDARDLCLGFIDGRYWQGQIREFRVWDHVRTGEQINDLLNSKLEGNESGLNLYYSFSEYRNLGVGEAGINDISDESGHNLHADAIGGPVQIPATRTHFVTVETGSHCGDVGLGVMDVDGVVDFAGKPLGGAGNGNGNFTSGELYMVDKDAPESEITTAPVTKVGGDVQMSYTTSDECLAVVNEVLYTREANTSWAPATTSNETVGSVTTTPSGDGVWHYAVVSTDENMNVDIPTGNNAVAGEVEVVYNDIANSSFTHHIPVGPGGTFLFPMEEMGVTIKVTLPQVTASGALTVTRFEDNSPASAAGLGTQHLVNQMILIQADANLALNGTVELELPYEETLLGSVAEGAINTVYAIDGGVVTTYDAGSVSVNQATNMVTVSGVNGFSEWYVGSSVATVGDWETLDY